MDTLSLTEEAKIYNGEKTISLTSGAGKTGQPLVKEWNYTCVPVADSFWYLAKLIQLCKV